MCNILCWFKHINLNFLLKLCNPNYPLLLSIFLHFEPISNAGPSKMCHLSTVVPMPCIISCQCSPASGDAEAHSAPNIRVPMPRVLRNIKMPEVTMNSWMRTRTEESSERFRENTA